MKKAILEKKIFVLSNFSLCLVQCSFQERKQLYREFQASTTLRKWSFEQCYLTTYEQAAKFLNLCLEKYFSSYLIQTSCIA